MSKMQLVKNPLVNQVKIAYRDRPLQTLAIGMGTVILAPTLISLVKPLTKAAIKTSVSLYEKTKGAIAETGEVIGDIVAEAKSEVAAEQAQKVGLAEGLIATSNNHQDTQVETTN